jgi:hypothetical protein
MARFRATTAALVRIRELLQAAYGPEPAVVAVYWTGPQAESRRLADGRTEWNRVSEGEWNIGFDRRAKFSGAQFEVIDGVEFVVNEYPRHVSIDGRTLDYVNGEFRVS